MWTLQTYVFRQLFTAFAIASGAMLFVALPGVTVSAMTRIAGVETSVLLQYVPMAMASFVPFVLPIAFMIALVGTYGRLAADNEWISVSMAGVSPHRMLVPALILGGLIAAGVFSMNAELLPWLRTREQAFRVEALRSVVRNLNPGRTDLQFGDFSLVAQHRDPETDTFHDVVAEIPLGAGQGGRQTILADSARFEFTDEHLVLLAEGVRGGHDQSAWEVESSTMFVPIEELIAGREETYSSRRYKTSSELLAILDEPDLPPRARKAVLYDFHERITNALAAVVFVLLGAPAGILSRRGNMLSAFGIAMAFVLCYWILSTLGDRFASDGALEPWLGAWGPLTGFALVGSLLTWRVGRS